MKSANTLGFSSPLFSTIVLFEHQFSRKIRIPGKNGELEGSPSTKQKNTAKSLKGMAWNQQDSKARRAPELCAHLRRRRAALAKQAASYLRQARSRARSRARGGGGGREAVGVPLSPGLAKLQRLGCMGLKPISFKQLFFAKVQKVGGL